MSVLGCWSLPASPSPKPAADPIPLPPIIAAAIAELQKYAAQGKLRPDRSLTARDVIFVQDERDLLDLVDALIAASGRVSTKLDEDSLKAELLSEFRSKGAFTLANRFPVVYNGASARWKTIEAHVAQGKADWVKYVIAADLVHEATHARGIRDEVLACRAQLEVLQLFFREGRHYLAAEIESVQQQCRAFEREGRYGKRLP